MQGGSSSCGTPDKPNQTGASADMLSTQPAIELLEKALATNPQLEATVLATKEGIVLMQAGDAAGTKMYALLAAQAYESSQASTGLEVGEKRIYVTTKEEYLFIVLGPASLPWGAYVAE